jgi:hypothetical protein
VVAATIHGMVGLFSGITAAKGEGGESSLLIFQFSGPLKFIITGKKVDLWLA